MGGEGQNVAFKPQTGSNYFRLKELNGKKRQNIRAIPPLEIQRTGKVATIIFLGLKSLCIELCLLGSGFEFSYF